MEIKISSPIEQELKLKKAVWHFFSKGIFIIIVFAITVGIILLCEKEIVMNKELGFWKPSTCLGLSIIFTALLKLISLLRTKERYVNSSEFRLIDANNFPTTELIINDDGIRFNGRNVASAFNWQYFLFYKVHKDFIILYRNYTYISSLIIGRSELSVDDYNNLLLLLSKNQIQRK